MRSQDHTPPQLADVQLVRRYIRLIAIRIFAVAVIEFLCVRIFGPELIDLHQDWALAGALVCFAAAIIAATWLAFQVWIDMRRFKQERRDLTRRLH